MCAKVRYILIGGASGGGALFKTTVNSTLIIAPIAAGLVCGVLDGLAAILITLAFGGSIPRMFQGIARAAIGPGAFEGGMKTVLLGASLHFAIAFGAAIVYFILSRFLPILLDQALLFGVIYGIAVHLFMQFVVIPLSSIGPRPFAPKSFFAVLMAHVIVVGPSIALTLRRFLK